MTDGTQFQTETPINSDCEALAGSFFPAQNLGGIALGDSEFGNQVFAPHRRLPLGLVAHADKFGHSEPIVNTKVRNLRNDCCHGSGQSSEMAKPKKALWKALDGSESGWYVLEWLSFKGLKQKDLVARTDYPKGRVNELVHGKERWNRDALYAFAHAIGIEPSDLLRLPPKDPVDDEFSRFVAKLGHKQKERALRILKAAEFGEEKVA